MDNRFCKILVSLITFFVMVSCVETFDFQSEVETFESLLVVEATITDEHKNHEILLSRTYQLDSLISIPESNALVQIVDDTQNMYNFTETSQGVYRSINQFAADDNRVYTLKVTANDGREYSSKSETLTQSTQIDNIYFERGFNDAGVEGVFAYIDSNDPTENSKYYRYEYEETFKVIVPRYSSYEIVFDEGSFFDYTIQLKTEQKETCYRTQKSNSIILTNTLDLTEDKIEKFAVRFIDRDSYIMSHRYSILIKQYVQTREAYNYYNTLSDLSQSDNLLSNSQPGYLAGNLFSTIDEKEKVIGFFQVSSVDKQRIYFNYEDFFLGEELPPYIIGCNGFIAPAVAGQSLGNDIPSHPLYDHIISGFQFYNANDGTVEVFPSEGPEILVLPECGDCTVLGENSPPDFWVE